MAGNGEPLLALEQGRAVLAVRRATLPAQALICLLFFAALLLLFPIPSTQWPTSRS